MSTRALIYVRQSLGKRGETADDSLSLDSQEAECRAHCDRHSWTVIDVIRDHDVRGSDPARPGMQQLMAHAKRRDMDCVVVFSMSRFARDAPYQELTWRELRRLKVDVESLKEPNIGHTLIRGMLGVVNQYQSEVIGQHVSAAARERARRGLTWGPIPRGYQRHDGKLTPDPVSSPIIEGIFRDWLDGHTLRAICERLTADGIQPRHGRSWETNTVAGILRNPVYRGDVYLGGRLIVAGAHDPLIEPDAWDAAQARFTFQRVRDKADCHSWAEGRVIHSCGARMYLNAFPSHGTTYPAFRCGNVDKVGNRCTHPRQRISQPRLEESVRSCLIADLWAALDPAAALRHHHTASVSDRTRSERARLQRQLDGIAGQRREAETMVMTRRRDLAWLDERDREFAAAESRIAGLLAALPVVPDERALKEAWVQIEESRRGVRALDGPGLGALLARVGVVVVDALGVSIRYNHPWSDLITFPTTVNPWVRFRT